MTLQQLKDILYNGGTLISGEKKLYKKDGKYYYGDEACSDHFTEYALTMVEWSELKPADEFKIGKQRKWRVVHSVYPSSLADGKILVVLINCGQLILSPDLEVICA